MMEMPYRESYRDLCLGNILLDAPQMFPDGFHPALQSLAPDILTSVKPRRRRFVKGLKYRFIDFGSSLAYPSSERRERVWGMACQDRTVPEHQKVALYDPFKVDLYTLGNVFKRTFVEVSKRELSFID